jgi:dihydroneopterin triphosphate diphosphatase
MSTSGTGFKLIDVYPYRLNRERDGVPEFLLLHRAPGMVYEGQWRMVGGKVEASESRAGAAIRELREELGTDALLVWAIPSVNHFYDHRRDEFHLVAAFAAELPAECPLRLNHEHDDARWMRVEEAAALLIWPEQIKMITYISTLLAKGDVPGEWIVAGQPSSKP